MQSAKYFHKTTKVKFKVIRMKIISILILRKGLIQLIIAMTQTEASYKHKLHHKEHCLTLLLFVRFAEIFLPK